MRLPVVGPRAFLRLAQISLGLVVVNIVSGAAVRLSDSGLGCPDWPTCSGRSVTPPLSFHPAVEFANRLVVVALSVAVLATLAAALRRTPKRRDLVWSAVAVAAGVMGEAVLGGIVVYSKLNPYAVMTHFMVGIALLTAAVDMTLRAGRRPGPGPARTSPLPRRLAGVFAAVVLIAVAAGTATTGAGPHAGGKGAVRLPVALDDMARVHSMLVITAAALLLWLLGWLARSDAPALLQDRARLVLVVMVGQGAIGYLQFFLHEPAVLVGFHVLGATLVWSAVLWMLDGLWHREPEDLAVSAWPSDGVALSSDDTEGDAAAVSGAASVGL